MKREMAFTILAMIGYLLRALMVHRRRDGLGWRLFIMEDGRRGEETEALGKLPHGSNCGPRSLRSHLAGQVGYWAMDVCNL